MDILRRTASPLLAARYQLELGHTLRAEADRHDAVEILRRRRHEDASGFPKRRFYLRTVNELADVRRPDLFLSLGDHHKIDRHLSSRAANGVESGQKRRLRSLL